MLGLRGEPARAGAARGRSATRDRSRPAASAGPRALRAPRPRQIPAPRPSAAYAGRVVRLSATPIRSASAATACATRIRARRAAARAVARPLDLRPAGARHLRRGGRRLPRLHERYSPDRRQLHRWDLRVRRRGGVRAGSGLPERQLRLQQRVVRRRVLLRQRRVPASDRGRVRDGRRVVHGVAVTTANGRCSNGSMQSWKRSGVQRRPRVRERILPVHTARRRPSGYCRARPARPLACITASTTNAQSTAAPGGSQCKGCPDGPELRGRDRAPAATPRNLPERLAARGYRHSRTPPGFTSCGAAASACVNCDPDTADNCSPAGKCECGTSGTTCGTGQVCVSGACVCNSASCSTGCCSGSTCARVRLHELRYRRGNMCVSCDATKADSCSATGVCSCGAGAACGAGQVCSNHQCVCNAASCPGGC